MALVDQWDTIQRGLDPRWSDARVVLTSTDASFAARAAALLAPAGPVRAGATLRFYVARRGPGVGPEAVRSMLRRTDAEGIEGTLELVAASETAARPAIERASLADAWDAALAVLPADWSDLLCELSVTSSDHLDRTALLMSPANPLRRSESMTFRFRAAHSFGYGASPGMVRRCLERVDEAGIPGAVRVLRFMSDTHPVGTQGPVWYVGGKAV
ncbi:MAG: hypothetical protein ACXWYO_01550 [Gaiellaceae bacterium]